ncbi:hypothetical protein BLNAU_17352 [Blattamonas nauphoetae]|uniref:Uncharacterized protein n=1 Tax=Blattamonas nauphoetae TaxID=2049346 RepID=A0ABQ9X7K4_9EUKA|nr:hypothetical protein BLNAU_17352 [Blattamonas nauphoetae]
MFVLPRIPFLIEASVQESLIPLLSDFRKCDHQGHAQVEIRRVRRDQNTNSVQEEDLEESDCEEYPVEEAVFNDVDFVGALSYHLL